MNPKAIHETTFADILDVIKQGISSADSILHKKGPSIEKTSSIARATEGMTLVFPVICSNACTIENASMVAKALERRNVSLLQIAFQSYNITSSTDAIDHLRKFHTNLDEHQFTLDKFANVMSSLGESYSPYIFSSQIRAINEDCRRNLNFFLEDDINETPLTQYTEMYKYGGGESIVIKEAKNPPRGGNGNSSNNDDRLEFDKDKYAVDKLYRYGRDSVEDAKDARNFAYKKERDTANDNYRRGRDSELDAQSDRTYQLNKDSFEHRKNMDYYNASKNDEDRVYRKNKDDREFNYRKGRDQVSDDLNNRNYNLNKNKFEYQKQRDLRQSQVAAEDKKQKEIEALRKNGIDVSDKTRQYLQNQLLPGEVKKANELQPSLMIINFYVNDKDKDLNIAQQAIAGVKSKIYAVDSSEVVNRIIKKHVDSNILLKLVKVSTREISFFKDFLLGLDDAKLDALTKSKRGSSSAIFKVLERRALGGKIRKRINTTNNAKAISSLVITMEEVEQLQKYNDVDVLNPSVIIPIMESLNLLYFVIVDTVSESIKLFIDGQTQYEDISFSSLEKESGDSTYKKVINLMTKISR